MNRFLVCWLPTTGYKRLRLQWGVSKGSVNIGYAKPSADEHHIGRQLVALQGDVTRMFDDYRALRADGTPA